MVNPVAELIKKKREENGYSQNKLAKVLGYTSGQFVSNWERGESLPPVDRLAKLTLLFGLKEDQLFGLYLKLQTEEKTKEYKKALDFHKALDKG